jgi:hypothetical protein
MDANIVFKCGLAVNILSSMTLGRDDNQLPDQRRCRHPKLVIHQCPIAAKTENCRNERRTDSLQCL